MLKKLIFSMLFLMLAINVHSEIYRGILPLATMKDLKTLFPGAEFTFVKTAWASGEESLYKVTGPGLPGKMMIKFTDSSIFFKKYVEQLPSEEVDEFDRNMAISSDETMSVDWVRYIPDTQIPIDRLVSKYGPAEESGFSEDTFNPYKLWKSKGVYASLSDDKRYALSIDYYFTDNELCLAYMKKYRRMPKSCDVKPTIGSPQKKKLVN